MAAHGCGARTKACLCAASTALARPSMTRLSILATTFLPSARLPPISRFCCCAPAVSRILRIYHYCCLLRCDGVMSCRRAKRLPVCSLCSHCTPAHTRAAAHPALASALVHHVVRCSSLFDSSSKQLLRLFSANMPLSRSHLPQLNFARTAHARVHKVPPAPLLANASLLGCLCSLLSLSHR
jgi:hypothetical protein